MDQWFNQLFEIIGRQIESKKVDMLLPEIYSELDIVARKQNITELHEIYDFVNSKNPIKTGDLDFNKEAYAKLKKEILKRHVMLRDLSILNKDLNELLLANNTRGMNKLLSTWKDSKFVYNHLQETIYNAKQNKKVIKPTQAIKTVKAKPPVKKEIQVVKENPPKQESELEVKKDLKLEPKVEVKKEVKTEIEKKEIPETIKRTKKEKEETNPAFSKEGFASKKINKSSFIEPDEVFLKPKIDRDVPKPKQKIIKAEVQDLTPEKPIEIYSEKEPIELFFDCVDIISKRYNMIVNIEVLRKLKNPKPNFSRFLLQYIDEQDRNARFFIELFKLLTEYSLQDLITYVIDKSFKIKKLCTFNVGLFNVEDLKTKSELLDIVINQDFEFIRMSNYERTLRTFIDELDAKDQTTEDIKKRVLEISRFAPKMIETFYASDALGFFKINLLQKNERIIESDNLPHLYWAMMLSTSLCVHVVRTKHSEFINSIDCIADFADQLIKNIDDTDIRFATIKLASSYIRRIYKLATKLPDYAEWWDRYKDDLLESKQKAIALLNPID